jgi:hypothetical protein
MADSRVQQTCRHDAEKAVEVGKNDKGGTSPRCGSLRTKASLRTSWEWTRHAKRWRGTPMNLKRGAQNQNQTLGYGRGEEPHKPVSVFKGEEVGVRSIFWSVEEHLRKAQRIR